MKILAAQSQTKISILLVAYLHDQVMWLRNHPSVFVWALASDKLPHPELEKRYRADLAQSPIRVVRFLLQQKHGPVK